MKIHIPDSRIVSLNKINSDLKSFLENQGHTISKDQISGDVIIQHFFKKRNIWKKFDKNILIQPIDGTIIKERYIRMLNEWDVIITPSFVGKKILIDNGITTKIEVIPNYWEDEILIDNGFFSKKFVDKKWTFYTESSGWERKNIKNLLNHFIDEFRNEELILLYLKISNVK
jgi:hypothetical protein